jgi:hypothetical protein
MKKLITLLTLILALNSFAQAPQGFNYQATVRNNSGQLLLSQNVAFKISIISGTPAGTVVYNETHNVTTDDLGHVSLVVGQGSATTGVFSQIDWSLGNHYMGIELNTGSGFVAMGTTQLLSVPYALYAGNAKNQGKTSIYLSGDITNAQAAAKIAQEYGVNTENIIIRNTSQLTSVDLSFVQTIATLEIAHNSALVSVNLNGLKRVDEALELSGNPMQTVMSFPMLEKIYGSIYINDTSLASLVFPVLTQCYYFGINNSSLTALNFPVLTNCTSLEIQGNSQLSLLGIAALVKSNSINISNNAFSSIMFSSLTNCGSFSLDNSQLTSVNLSALTNCESMVLTNNALPDSQINAILNKMLLVAPASGKFIDLSGQTPSAPPTGQGIVDKTTLENNGNTVITD